MFRAKTVFVVGAGASAELNFPVGAALLEQIAKKVYITYEYGSPKTGDSVVREALRASLNAHEDVEEFNSHLHSAWQLVDTAKQAFSIDNVLHALEDEKATFVGKLGIVRCILEAEKSSPLSGWRDDFAQDATLDKLANTWLDALGKLLVLDVTRSRFADSFQNVSFINFNYDRSIEQFLPFFIARYFGVQPHEVREAMEDLTMIRPYGRAGCLPWQAKENSVQFGNGAKHALLSSYQQIKTFTEQVEEKTLINSIKAEVESADRIVFVGFGFHRQNLELLRAKVQPHCEILGSCFGMSQTDSEAIESELDALFSVPDNVSIHHKSVRLFNLRCGQSTKVEPKTFFGEVGRTLLSTPAEDPRMEVPSFDAFRAPTSLPRFSP